MARPGTTRRRVSHLVGRFEQLATIKAERSSAGDDGDEEAETEEEERPRSHHGELSLNDVGGHSTFANHHPPGGRRAFSVASPEAAPQGRLADERQRRRAMQDECEMLRRRCRDDDEARDALRRKLEHGELARQGYEEQRRYMEGKIECMRQQLCARDETERLQRGRTDAEMEELRRQLELSEGTRQADRESAKVEIQRQRNMLAVRLRDTEARAESALKNAQNFEKQLLELKQSMSTSTRVEKQATDQELVDKMGRLNHELQNWVVNAFRKVKIDASNAIKQRFESLPSLAGSNMLCSLYGDFDTSTKLFAFQSTIMYLMMPIFEHGYFFGLPDGLQSLRTATEYTKSATASYNEWRSQTFLFLHKAEGDLRDAINVATKERKCQLIDDISDTLSTLTKTELNDGQLANLRKVVEHAISLSRLFSIQRAVYTCVLPDSSTASLLPFDQELMEDVFDAEDTSERLVRYLTFPAVIKAGDETGDNMMVKNVVMKAKVVCHAEESDEDDEDWKS